MVPKWLWRRRGITARDYLTWCRDPEPPAFDRGLGSISIDADPLAVADDAALARAAPIIHA